MDPLWDLRGRTVALMGAPNMGELIDALLRLHNAKHWQKPITLYILAGPKCIGASEALTLIHLFWALRSPVSTIALAGLLRSPEALVLTAGSKGHRYLLANTLLHVGPVDPGDPFVPNGPIGLAHLRDGTASPKETAKDLLEQQLLRVFEALKMAALWRAPGVLTASEAIQAGLADAIIPIHPPEPAGPVFPNFLPANRAGRNATTPRNP